VIIVVFGNLYFTYFTR